MQNKQKSCVARYGFVLNHVVQDDLAVGMQVAREFWVATASFHALELTLVFVLPIR